MSCPNRGFCPLFPHLMGLHGVWRRKYCDKGKDTYGKCVRYDKSLDGVDVPPNAAPERQGSQHLRECR
jgi:hypothetical protein